MEEGFQTFTSQAISKAAMLGISQKQEDVGRYRNIKEDRGTKTLFSLIVAFNSLLILVS
jgi:hypothetical protein